MQFPKEYTEAELLRMTEQLRTHQGAAHRLITDLGKAHYVAAREVVAEYLQDPSGSIRGKALITLAIDFHLPEYQETARQFLLNDYDGDCKLAAISVLGYFQANANDRATLALLAEVVRDSMQNDVIRTYAYETMQDVVHSDPTKRVGQVLSIPKDVDWAFVDSYLPTK